MKTAILTPVERFRPRDGMTRIEYTADGEAVSRDASVRMDPHVTAVERRFDHALEQTGVAAFWIIGVPGVAIAFYWSLTEGVKLVYSFAVNHPFGL